MQIETHQSAPTAQQFTPPFPPLALRLMAAVPYVYAVLLGLLLAHLFGGSK